MNKYDGRIKFSKIEWFLLNLLFMLIIGVITGWLVVEKYFISSIIVCVIGILSIISFNIYRTQFREIVQKIFIASDGDRSHGLQRTDWLTGQDLMKVYDISQHQLQQHIEKGLPVYSEETDITFDTSEARPMTENDLLFEMARDNSQLGYKMSKWLFKRVDIGKHIKANK